MPPKARPVPERLAEKTEVAENGCWKWLGGTNGKGYGVLVISNRKHYVHRLSYEIHVGPIPAGLEIDHVCRNRGCLNPEHLEAVTRKVNQNRGYSVSGNNRRKTHCPKGHPYDDENTYEHGGTGGERWRQCATCRAEYRAGLDPEERRAYARAYRAANRERLREHRRQWRAKRKAAGLRVT